MLNLNYSLGRVGGEFFLKTDTPRGGTSQKANVLRGNHLFFVSVCNISRCQMKRNQGTQTHIKKGY